MFSLIFAWINGWVNNGEAGYLKRHRAHYDVIVIIFVVVTMESGVNTWANPLLATGATAYINK